MAKSKGFVDEFKKFISQGSVIEFRFFFDMAASVRDESVTRPLSELEAHCDKFTFLGCYEEY